MTLDGRSPFRLAALAFAGLALAAVDASADRPSSRRAKPEPQSRPDILLVTVSALRADHVSAYGHDEPTTPFLDSLAKQGVRFEKAYAPSSWAVPSLVSLHASAHVARHGAGGTRGALPALPPQVTLAEALQAAGYRTYGMAAYHGLPAEQGWGRGFDKYESVGSLDSEALRSRLAPWLAELGSGEPWFLWVHFFDPQAPYAARQPWLRKFWSGSPGAAAALADMSKFELDSHVLTLDSEGLAFLRALHDSEIRAVDEALRSIHASGPRAKNALVAVAGAHGVEFLEHGAAGQGRTLFEESVRVPLVMRLPGRKSAGRVSHVPVTLLDVMPTLLEAAGVAPPPGLAGEGLLASGRAFSDEPRTVVLELQRETTLRAVVDGRWKYIADVSTEGVGQLYDLADDPAELNNVAYEHPDRVAAFQRLLSSHAAENEPPVVEAEATGKSARPSGLSLGGTSTAAPRKRP